MDENGCQPPCAPSPPRFRALGSRPLPYVAQPPAPPGRSGRVATPAGGSPAVLHITSHQAATCGARSSPVGDQEARSSSSVVDGSPCLSPKLSDTARVTVPDTPAY